MCKDCRLMSLSRFACRSPVGLALYATFGHGGAAVKRCPVCGSADVQRSHLHHSEGESHRFRSPYRCQSCGRRFWILSRKARIGIGAVAAGVCAIAAILLTVGAMLAGPGAAPSPTAASTSSSGVVVPAPVPSTAAPTE